MQENFLHFLSKEPANFAINGQNIGLIDNKNIFELDVITKTDRIFVSYNPISYKINKIGYTSELNTSYSPTSDNEYITIIPFPNNNYDIIMKPFYYYQISKSKVILNQNVGKYFVSIVSNSATKITIFSGASIVFDMQCPTLIGAKADIKKDILIITGIINSEKYYLILLDTNNFEIILNEEVDSIDYNEEYIQSLKNMHDISHHSLVCKVNFSDKFSQKYHVYENNTMSMPRSRYLCPYDFLECIKCGDENKAKSYLSSNYSNITFDKLQNYFGNIENIYFNRHEVYQDKLNYTIKSNTYKNYNFIMSNDKIIDIAEVF